MFCIGLLYNFLCPDVLSLIRLYAVQWQGIFYTFLSHPWDSPSPRASSSLQFHIFQMMI